VPARRIEVRRQTLSYNNALPSGRRRRRHDNRDMILMAVSDSPLTLSGIKDHFFALPRRFGIFSPTYRLTPAEESHFDQELARDLNRMETEGWILREGERYELTDLGQMQARLRLAGVRKAVALVRNLVRPETVSRITVGIHLVLAAVKLPAAVFSGSAGLLNDSIDTLLDGFSSILVYFGVRFRRERATNLVLVVLMLVTGVLTLIESARRLFIPQALEADPIVFVAVVFSGFVCLFLGLYQRYVGLKNGNLALVTQSVDSRNHVLVAFGVTAGLLAAWLHFPLLDAVVGVLVSVLILRSGMEQAVGWIRSWESADPDLRRHSKKFFGRIVEFRRTQLRDWLLFLVESRHPATRDALMDEAARALTFDQFPLLREIGAQDPAEVREQVAGCVEELFAGGWLAEEDGRLHLTPTGKRRLLTQTLPVRRTMSRALVHHLPWARGVRGFGAGHAWREKKRTTEDSYEQ
jgi:hypothetical protein